MSRDRMQPYIPEHIKKLTKHTADVEQLAKDAAYILEEVPIDAGASALFRSWLNLRTAWLQRARELGITQEEHE